MSGVVQKVPDEALKGGSLPKGFLHSLRYHSPPSAALGSAKISVVMPSYNQAAFIERSLLSVLNQSYRHFELIVIDGASTDGTVEVIEKYRDYIAHFVSEPDEGQSDALNKGFALASGDLYGWLNSDDIYCDGAFELAAKMFEENKGAALIFGDWLSIDARDRIIDKHFAFDFSINHLIYEGFHLNAQAMFWRELVHSDFRGFYRDLNFTMDYQMIVDFGLRFGGDFIRVPIALGAFRRYEGQKTTLLSERVKDEHKRIAQRYDFSKKFELLGRVRRLYFRVRRLCWYTARGGAMELRKRLIYAVKNAG